jgi:RNA polymerase sigma-70 factor (ECF subfamily)
MTLQSADSFESHRPKLFAVAYRMLGSASEAEDVVQDAWLRYAGSAHEAVRSTEAYLTTIVTRLCLDRLKSARMTRESYVGPWLPEPLLTDKAPGPEQSAALAESVTLAFMLLLETLSPEERATFLLREVFEYEYQEIADVLDTTAANCRQLFHRAKARLRERRPRAHDDLQEKRRLVERFVAALQHGDAGEMTSVLADDVGLWSDGGGKTLAARRPVFGGAAVAKILMGFRRTAAAYGVDFATVALDIVEANGEPAMAIRVDGRIDSVYSFSIEDGAIAAVRVVRNPDKLRYIARQLAM